MIKICRHVAPSTRNYNYDHSLWRGAQLYSVAFLYSLMSIIAGMRIYIVHFTDDHKGTYSAMRATFYDRYVMHPASNSSLLLMKSSDLSMWSSFRVSNATLDAVDDFNVACC